MELSIIDPEITRFIRAGRPLRYWMDRLVDIDLNRRHRAARYLSKMHSEMTEMPPGADYMKYLEAFDRKVQGVAAADGFDRQAYVGRLVDVIRESQAEQDRLNGLEQARIDTVTNRIEAQINATTDESRKQTLGRRLIRASCTGFDCRTPAALAKQKHLFVSITAGIVFSSLGAQALAAPAVIRRMLKDHTLHFHAMRAISRATADVATPFADDLLDVLLDEEQQYDMTLNKAVAVAVANDPDRLRELFERALRKDEAKASIVLSVLAYVGPPVRTHVPASVDRLAELASRDDGVGWAAAQTLGRILSKRPS